MNQQQSLIVHDNVRAAINEAFRSILLNEGFSMARVTELTQPFSAIIDKGFTPERMSKKFKEELYLELYELINGPTIVPLRIPKNPEGPTPEILIQTCQVIAVRTPPAIILPPDHVTFMVDLIAANR